MTSVSRLHCHNACIQAKCNEQFDLPQIIKKLFVLRHLDQGGHTGLAKPEEFHGEGWDTFVNIKVQYGQTRTKGVKWTEADSIFHFHFCPYEDPDAFVYNCLPCTNAAYCCAPSCIDFLQLKTIGHNFVFYLLMLSSSLIRTLTSMETAWPSLICSFVSSSVEKWGFASRFGKTKRNETIFFISRNNVLTIFSLV